jgi:hypothetical protein
VLCNSFVKVCELRTQLLNLLSFGMLGGLGLGEFLLQLGIIGLLSQIIARNFGCVFGGGEFLFNLLFLSSDFLLLSCDFLLLVD